MNIKRNKSGVISVYEEGRYNIIVEGDEVEGDDADFLVQWPVFKQWLQNFDHDNIELGKIVVQSVDGVFVGESEAGERRSKVIFAKFLVFFRLNKKDERGIYKVGTVFMRPPSVSVFIIVECEETGRRYILLTKQARVPAGTLSFLEIAAGTLEDDGVVGRAVTEIEEETSLKVLASELKLLGDYYPSVGACPEIITAYYVVKKLPRAKIENMATETFGLAAENELINVVFVSVESFIQEASRLQDGKIFSALGLIMLNYNPEAVVRTLSELK